MPKWIPILKVGTFKDSSGKEHSFSEQRLDGIVAKYIPANHEAPEVIGHPKDNAPAWGWVGGLKREGQLLFYEPKGRVEEFQAMLDKGMFKKRSVSLYPDDTLRHVGYLGAQPPAVKGLPDPAQFAEGLAMTIEFSEASAINTIGYTFQRIRDWLIEKFDLDTADRLVPNYTIDELKTAVSDEMPGEMSNASPAFSEHTTHKEDELDVELKKKLDEKTKEAADFAEAANKEKTEKDELKSKLVLAEASNRKAEFSTFCEGLMKEGKLTPAMKPAVLDFMEILSGIETFDFAEAEEKKVAAKPLDKFKVMLTGMPKIIEFGEQATKEKMAGDKTDMTNANEIAAKAVEFKEAEEKAGRTITVTEAVNHITSKGGK